MSNSWIDSGDGTGICCDADVDANLLQLKLKKPRAWRWELTTSRSSPNIAMPRIMLFNHKGDLLVDANRQVDDAVYRSERVAPRPPKRRSRKLLRAATTNLERTLQDDEDTGLGSLDSAERQSYKQRDRTKSHVDEVSRTVIVGERRANGYNSWRNSVPDEVDFGSLQICGATDSDRSPVQGKRSPSQPEEDVNINVPWRRKWSLKEKSIDPPRITKRSPSQKIIDSTLFSDLDDSPHRLPVSKVERKPFHSNGHLNGPSPVPDPFERRALSFKEVRFNVHPPSDEEDRKPKEKRRYRRSNTSDRSLLTSSSSILERLSAMKCRMSSPEFETASSHDVQTGPRYFLRTSRAGTLVVAEENTKQRRTRRRAPKTSSTENVLSPSNSSLRPNDSYRQRGLLGYDLGVPSSQSQSMNNFGEMNGARPRRKMIPIRRHRSDGNIILATSSDDDNQANRSESRGKHRKSTSSSSWRQNPEDAKGYIESKK